MRGWDDPRMPTLSGIRRRGYTPEAMRAFCGRIGVSKTNGMIDMGRLEDVVREDLNKRALRVMAVLQPLKVVIDNYPEGQTEELDAVNNPEDAARARARCRSREVLYIEQDDFREDPPKDYFRLSPGPRSAAALRLLHQVRGRGEGRATGEVVEVHCTYDPGHARRQRAGRPQGEGDDPLGVGGARRRRRGAALRHAVHQARPGRRAKRARTARSNLNPKSLEVLTGCKLEPSLARRAAGQRAISSSGWATSASIPTARQARWSSTGRWR